MNDQKAAAEWAYTTLSCPFGLILDTETTGLDDRAEIVQIAVCNLRGDTLMNSLVRPTTPIPQAASRIHRITDDMVANAPTWPQVAEHLIYLLAGAELIIYNADYDTRLIRQSAHARGVDAAALLAAPVRIQCAMHYYSQWIGEWNDYYGNYRWQRLPGGDHSARGDCLATLEVMRRMATAIWLASIAIFRICPHATINKSGLPALWRQ